MNSDFKDALCFLLEEDVRFLIVGGYAVIHYTLPRVSKVLSCRYARIDSRNCY